MTEHAMKLEQARSLYIEVKSLAPLASAEWSESYNLSTSQAEICIPNRFTGEVEPIAHILPDCPYDDRRMMLRAPIYIAALLTLLEETFKRLRALDPPVQQKPRDKNPYAKACAIASGRQDFRAFLRTCHGLEATDNERVDTRVRSLLNIQTRTELDTDEHARARWFSLYREFESWKGRQR